jgi:hypothetical protein
MFGAGATTPAPETATLTVGLVVSLLPTTIDPPSVVVSVGAYVTVTTWLVPGATLNDAGESVYSALVPEARATVPVRVAVPGFEIVKDLATVSATVTFPKVSEVGLTAILGADGTTPAPLTARFVVGLLEALLVIAMQPLSAPAADGA